MPQENMGKGNKICRIYTPKEHFAQRMRRELAGVRVVAPVEPVKVVQVKCTAHVPTPSLPVGSLQLERGSSCAGEGLGGPAQEIISANPLYFCWNY